MATQAPLDPEIVKRLVELAEGGMSRNDIARELGIGASTVSRHAARAGVSFGRASTKAATAARQADNAAKRAKLAGALIADIDRTRRGIMNADAETPKDYEQQARALSALTRGFSDIVKSSPIDDSFSALDGMRDALASFAQSLEAAFPDDNYGRPDDEEPASSPLIS